MSVLKTKKNNWICLPSFSNQLNFSALCAKGGVILRLRFPVKRYPFRLSQTHYVINHKMHFSYQGCVTSSLGCYVIVTRCHNASLGA